MNDRLAEVIVAMVQARRDDIVGLCAELVAAPSVTPPGDTRNALAVADRFLRDHALVGEVHALEPAKPNLVVSVEGARPGPHIVLNGHLDTMDPADEASWTVPLFELTHRDGRLYGLGIGNMKGADAALLTALCILAEHRQQLAGTVTLTLVSDEVRFGDNGTAFLLDRFPQLRGDAVISGEGSGWMTLAVAEKGVVWLDLDADGPAGHASAATTGRTAVARLARAIASLDELNDWEIDPPDDLAEFLAEPGHPGRRVAASVGVIEAGDARSMLAPRARALVDVRVPPGLTLARLDERVEALVAPSGARWARTRGWEASWTALDAPLTRAIRDAATTVRGTPPTPTVRHPASDVMRWRLGGTAGVCYGPQPTLSAGIDDYALEQDVVDCAAVYALACLALVDHMGAH